MYRVAIEQYKPGYTWPDKVEVEMESIEEVHELLAAFRKGRCSLRTEMKVEYKEKFWIADEVPEDGGQA